MDDLEPSITKVVISQPMYFPWVGMLEQVRLADVFIHYSDVQFARGFFNRVQVKTAKGTRWLTVPLRELHRGQLISEVAIDERVDWRSQHRDTLRQAYRNAPYLSDLLKLFDGVAATPAANLADLSVASIMALVDYFGLASACSFRESRQLGIQGSSSRRLLDLTLAVGGRIYITGHGARSYLEHDTFESAGIEVRYMDYRRIAYSQLHGAFTPYVTGLDLVANCGWQGREVICSSTKHWRQFTQ
jgi:hypothetical protein